MTEYIEREAAIKSAKHAWAKGLEPSQYIEIIPAADVAPVRHGRWELVGADKRGRGGVWQCAGRDGCGKSYPHKCDYCPNCGAKMGGDK